MFKKWKNKIEQLESDIIIIKDQLKLLNCPHNFTRFVRHTYDFHFEYYEECLSCKKRLQIFYSNIELRKAEIKKMKSITKEREKKFKEMIDD